MSSDTNHLIFPPRDLVGYGKTPPNPNWPNGAKVAVSFVLNYEEGAECNIQDGDDVSEHRLCEILNAEPLHKQRNLNVESNYEYGSRAGFWRIYRAFVKRNMKLTVYACGKALEKNVEASLAMFNAGFEMASHGYRWLDYQNISEDVERKHIQETIACHEKLFGEKPLGFYQGKPSMSTVKIIAETESFLYENDIYCDDLPYWNYNYNKPLLMIPYAFDSNDMKFVSTNGFVTGDQFFEYLRDTFDYLCEEADEGQPKMMSIGLHCRVVGHAGRMSGLSKFLDYLLKKGNDAWVCTRSEIARHWIKNFPPLNA